MAQELAVDVADSAPAQGMTAALLAVVMWGAGPVMARGIHMPGMAVVFYRLWIGGLATTAVLYARKGRLTWRVLRLSTLGGIAFGINISFFFSALKLTTVANATVISALQPALLFLVAGPMFGEHVRGRDVAWTATAIGGVALVVFGAQSSHGHELKGDLLAVGALFAWSWYFVASKQARQQLGALEYQTAMTLISAAVATPIALVSGQSLAPGRYDATTWMWLLLIVAGGAVGHLAMNYAHATVRLTITSLLTLSTPVTSAVGAALFLHEGLSWPQAFGMAIVLAALAIVITGRTRAESLRAAEESLVEPR
jgi:drug/metabolite transporter (DMT)-like permease